MDKKEDEVKEGGNKIRPSGGSNVKGHRELVGATGK
jgi:hypothetical protein